ncbi:MAG: hypothetical protein ACI3ZL_04170 [Candidatus Cryptobacteroides sp.]
MYLKKTLAIALAVFMAVPMMAEKKEAREKKGAVKEHLENHFKFYGFIRNYFTFDTRESVSGTGNLFYYLPKDQNLNANGEDLNQQSQFRFLALTSRVGVDVSGYHVGNVHFGAKVEADFYAGLTGSTGTATLRLRQAYATVAWKELPMCGEQKAQVGLKIGQAWHPMAADHPHVFSLEVGAPFGPFSRTPLVQMDADLGKHWTITAAAIWQMQYTSAGPAGSSADYIKYGCTPEMYAGVTYKTNGFLARAGVDMVSIKPRITGTDSQGVTVKVKDRITTVSPFVYLQYSYKLFSVKAKTIYGSAGDHFNLMGGYAKVGENEDGSWEYAPTRNSSSWLSLSVGKKWQGVLFLGYVKNFGLADGASSTPVDKADIYFCKNGYANINQMYRINPEIMYNFGKFTVGLEYQYTAVQYGDNFNEKALATDNLRWIGNNRVQAMVKFTF